MKKVYIVFGETGEYSDHRQWMVRAFHEKRKAFAFAKKCQSLLDEQNFKYFEFKHQKWKHTLDPNFDMDYTGTKYYVMEVPFEE